MDVTPTSANFDAIDPSWAAELSASFGASRANRIARNAVTSTNIMAAARDVTRMRTYSDTYGVSIKRTGKVTNQRHSGRCWMFSAYNVARQATLELLDVEDFEFSQVFGMFYDKLEKANAFLERIIQTADLPADDRHVCLLLEHPIGDGNFHVSAMNLIAKYGLVPKSAMPETACSKDSSQMNQQLTRLLHKYALELRRLVSEDADAGYVRARKQEMLADVHQILCICLGEPPVTFDFVVEVGKKARVNASLLSPITPAEPDDDGKGPTAQCAEVGFASDSSASPEQASAANDESASADASAKDAASKKSEPGRRMLRDCGITPRTFAKRYVPIDPHAYVDLGFFPGIDNPLYAVYHLGMTDSVLGGMPTDFVNVPLEVVEDAAIESLKAGVPVGMACDVAQEFPRHIDDFPYVLGTDSLDLEGLFGVELDMDRADMIEARETQLTHAMTFQGVQLGDDGRPQAWRVENSWGTDAGKDGYLVMSGDWFRTYGAQVSVQRRFVPEHILELWDAGATIRLEPWSNLGRLMREAR